MPVLEETFDLFNSLPDPIQVVDLDGRIVFVNSRMMEIFGNTRGNICFKAIKKGGCECADCPRKRGGYGIKHEFVEIETIDDRRMLVSHSALMVEGSRYIVETYRDITDYRRALEEEARIKAEVQMARAVQDRCITVHRCPERIRWDFRYLPARGAAGDFLNSTMLDDDRLAITVADVSGQGMGAAAVTFMLKIVYDQLHAEKTEAASFPSELNKRLRPFLPPGQFLSFAMILIDLDAMSYRMVNAGHLPVLHLFARQRELGVHMAQLPPLGVLPAIPCVQETEAIPLANGDRLLAYTDGVLQGFGNSFADFRAEVERSGELAIGKLLKRLLPSKEAPLEDDVTLFIAEIEKSERKA